MTVQIIEIMGRATQGVTKPFICRGEDEQIYFVKGRGAGRRGLICEWVAGNLAQGLGLPVAHFEIVDVPQALIQLGSRSDLSELGAGPAFGSQKILVVELSVSHIEHVSAALKQDVLAFDWWVQNADRTLSTEGGNPNLFWAVDENKLVVLDHNQAFDLNFSPQNFVDSHAFSEEFSAISEDWVVQARYCTRFEEVMAGWDDFCNTVPAEWWFIDPECTLPVNFDRADIKQRLLECRSEDFWKMK